MGTGDGGGLGTGDGGGATAGGGGCVIVQPDSQSPWPTKGPLTRNWQSPSLPPVSVMQAWYLA